MWSETNVQGKISLKSSKLVRFCKNNYHWDSCLTALEGNRLQSAIQPAAPVRPPLILLHCSRQKTPDSSWGRLSEALGNLGSGNLEGGGFGERVGKGEVSLQATWDRGGWILSQLRGFQVSRRESKGEQRGISKGRRRARGMRRVYCNLWLWT